MIKIPLPDIINKIKQETKLSEQDINKKIDEKLKQLSGLISKEGAAHIIANELGVKLFDSLTGKLQIKNILAGMRDVETIGRVIETSELREFKTNNREGKVASLVLGDETGTIRVVLWGSQAENITKLEQNAIVKIVSGYVRENQGIKEIHMNERSKLIINPEGETIGEVKQTTNNIIRKQIRELEENDNNIEILGTIVQIFDPRFFEVCPDCNKRARQHEGSFVCEQHGNINPQYSYVFNLFLDDGTENIRAVFFKNQAEHLLEMTPEQILVYRENPEKFEEVKTKLLGNIIKVIGRVTKNKMFDRLEFVTQQAFPKPDPEQELKRLETNN